MKKRIVALCLALIMIGTMIPLNAFATTVNINSDLPVSFSYFALADGTELRSGLSNSAWTRSLGDYDAALSEYGDKCITFNDPYKSNAKKPIPMMFVCKGDGNSNPYLGGDYGQSGTYAWLPVFVYCIQHGAHSANRELHNADTINTSKYYQSLSDSAQIGIAMALAYGYPNSGAWTNAANMYAATQLLIWAFQTGYLKVDPITGAVTGSDAFRPNNAGAASAYDSLKATIIENLKAPSLSNLKNGKAELTWDGSKYSWTGTDKNSVLKNYGFAAASGAKTYTSNGITATISGNTLTVTSTSPTKTSASFILKKVSSLGGAVTSSDDYMTASVGCCVLNTNTSGNQTKIMGAPIDPPTANFTAEIAVGNCNLIKKSEDGKVSGIKFNVTGPNGYSTTITTGTDGTAKLSNIPAGTYTFTEVTPDKYAKQKSQTVTVKGGETATVNFSNILKKFTLTLKKRDSETGNVAQGDASLKGAEYGLYKGGNLLKTYITDSNGQFITDEYVCGTDYTIKELKAPEGYILDPTVYDLDDANPSNFTNEHNSISFIADEDVIKGSVGIIKYKGTSTEDMVIESGAEFELYLKSAGSYAKAKSDERDILVTNDKGAAQSKELPYGTYILHQIKGEEGYKFIADQEFVISKDSELVTSKIPLINLSFTSYIKVIKKDAETDKVIPISGATFEVYDKDKKLITFKEYDSKKHVYVNVTTFETNEEGFLVIPTKLTYGTYYLKETVAPYGYVLDSTLQKFSVTEDTYPEVIYDIEYDEMTDVVKKDTPQKGVIKVLKQGEVFSSVEKTDDIYAPIYSIQGLEGAEYEITAAEDIVTPDGTVRVAKGTVVDTIVTGSDGYALSKSLYLGKYIVTETKAPFGMVLNTEPNQVELSYGGQDVEVVTENTSFVNDRQRISIDIYKEMEINDIFNVGVSLEVTNVKFGLYANEDIVASDGTMIPKDGLVDVVSINEYGQGVTSADIPFGEYYFKEIETDEHYIINETIWIIDYEYAGQTVEIVRVQANDGIAIENTLKYGNIVGTKVNEKDEPLEGCVFGLFSFDETEFTYDKAYAVVVSDKEGKFEFADIPYGHWLVRELETVEGYVLDEEPQEAIINEDGDVVNVDFVNEPITGELQITKIDIADGRLIPNAGFRIKDENGNIVVEGYTDENGVAIFTLRYGKYTYQEFDAPDGYILDESEYPFEITENGQIIKAEMTNEKEPEPEIPDIPKTGDNTPILPFTVVTAASLAGLTITQRKRKKDEK